MAGIIIETAGEHDQTLVNRSSVETLSSHIGKLNLQQAMPFDTISYCCMLCFKIFGDAVFQFPCRRKLCKSCFHIARRSAVHPDFHCVCNETHDSRVFTDIIHDECSMELRITDTVNLRNHLKCPSFIVQCGSCKAIFSTELEGQCTIAGWCVMCRLLCAPCFQNHTLDGIFFPLPRHTTITDVQLTNVETRDLPSFCVKHNEIQRLYCKQCKNMKCSQCAVYTGCVDSHKLQENIPDVLQDMDARNKLEHLLSCMPRAQSVIREKIVSNSGSAVECRDLCKVYNEMSFLDEEMHKILTFGSETELLNDFDRINESGKLCERKAFSID